MLMNDGRHPLIQRYGTDECLKRILGQGYRDMEAFLFFINFVQIPHKADRRYVYLADVITHLQLEVLEAVTENQYTYVLKSRKEGISSGYAAWNYRHIAFVENFESLILSLDNISTMYIKSMYQSIHDRLPEEIRPETITPTNRHEMSFDTGGWLRSMTAATDAGRGSTPRSIHASEFAQYTDIKRTLEAAFQAGTDDVEVILESTAKGMNEAYNMWIKEGNGYKKVFITWMDSPNCMQETCVSTPPKELLDAQEKHGFSQQHLNWATDRYNLRCGSSWDTFCQEYPMVAEDAFIASGTRFFTGISFPGVEFDDKVDVGYVEYEEPKKFQRYVLGADVASGSPVGDFSAFCIINCQDRQNPRIVATYYKRVPTPEFADILHKYLSRYHDPLAVIEINGPGTDIMHRLRERGYANMFRRMTVDKVEGTLTEKLGWLTSESSRYMIFSKMLAHMRGGHWAGLELGKMKAVCKRLMYEINSVIYNNVGKIEHAPSKHDDLVIATGLALQGMDQAYEDQPVIRRNRPNGIREILEFEAETGLMLENLAFDYFDDFDPTHTASEENFPSTPGL